MPEKFFEIVRENGVILALDVGSKDEALRILDQVNPFIDAIKVGYPLTLSTSMGFIKELKKYNKPIIADFKVADIPNTSRLICELAKDNGADFIIVQGFVGEDVVLECSRIIKTFVVTEMSHPGALDFLQKDAEKIALIAKKYAYGIVAPATRPERVSKLRKIVGSLVIISPGVKAQGAGPGDAIKAGATFEIVGRGIYQSENPREIAEEISINVKRAIESICQ